MIHLYETTGSTNELALAAAREGAEHGATWLSDEQTAGRGRREVGGQRRDWFSPPGTNIYMSVLLRPHVPASEVAGVTLATGAHVCGAIHEATGVEDLWLKWPNDIWVGSRKLAGILTEAVTGANGVEALVVGIGINVNIAASDVPDELEDIVTSVRIENEHAADRLRIAFAVRHAILAGAAEYFGGGWHAVRDDIERWDGSSGHTVEVEVDGDWAHGTARGIAENGALRVEVDGDEVLISSGEVRFQF